MINVRMKILNSNQCFIQRPSGDWIRAFCAIYDVSVLSEPCIVLSLVKINKFIRLFLALNSISRPSYSGQPSPDWPNMNFGSRGAYQRNTNESNW